MKVSYIVRRSKYLKMMIRMLCLTVLIFMSFFGNEITGKSRGVTKEARTGNPAKPRLLRYAVFELLSKPVLHDDVAKLISNQANEDVRNN